MELTVDKKPETITELREFLSAVIKKILALTPVSFGKFTPKRLPEDYLYNKWIGKKKDFADMYLNMDSGAQILFINYVLGHETEHDYHLAARLHHFFLFCWNFDSTGCENPFTGKYGPYLSQKATGKKNPQWIKAPQIIKMFDKLDNSGKDYITWCAFGKKK